MTRKAQETGPMFLHARCHLSVGVEVALWPDTGELVINCAKCHKRVAVLHVASDDPTLDAIRATGCQACDDHGGDA